MARSLAEDASPFIRAGERVYWVYLLGALGIAVGFFAFLRVSGRIPKSVGLGKFLFPQGIWLHPSARLDYWLLAAKAVIRALLVAPWMLSALGIALFVVRVLRDTFGAQTETALPAGVVMALYTVTAFLAADFSRYALHRALHAVPILWQLHQVHHSAEVLTPLTLYRTHPLESVLYNLRGAVVTGALSGAFFYVFPGRAVQLEIAGIAALGYVFNLLGANLRHSHIWLTYGARVEHLFISPAQHQIHHSASVSHHDANFGSFLAIWDWAFGSLRTTHGVTRVRKFGIREDHLNHHPHRLGSSLWGPLSSMLPGRKPLPRNEKARAPASV